MSTERPEVFECGSEHLLGITHIPDKASRLGILVVIGGPTYRVGPQRSNVVLARELAKSGYPVMRFDFRGTGDSDGVQETPRQGEAVLRDIKVALDRFYETVPDLQGVVLWGLCRGALRSLQFAQHDPRVVGIVMLNPRVDSEQITAVATLRQYYWQRLTNPNLYRKIFSGDFSPIESIKGLFRTLTTAAATSPTSDSIPSATDDALAATSADTPVEVLVEEGFRGFRGNTLIILGGGDLEATKFKEIIKRSPSLKHRIGDPDFQVRELAGANHTFSTQEWRDRVISWTKEWVASQ